jgi:hypothetical protein
VNSIIDETYRAEGASPAFEIELSMIHCDRSQITVAQVGRNGVTRIILYKECGQTSWVPWAAIYRGDFLAERVDLAGMRICYKERK